MAKKNIPIVLKVSTCLHYVSIQKECVKWNSIQLSCLNLVTNIGPWLTLEDCLGGGGCPCYRR